MNTILLQLAGVRSQKLDIDNGEGNVLKDLPCVMRFNQLYCSDPGSAYPTDRIGVFADDNKALLRRMFGELQVTMQCNAMFSLGIRQLNLYLSSSESFQRAIRVLI